MTPLLTPTTIHSTADLLEFHEACCARARELMSQKNHDYSGVVDVMQNFRMFEELGIVVRAGDKLSRLKSWVEKCEYRVKTESVQDTALDLLNYAILFLAYGREARTVRSRSSDLTGQTRPDGHVAYKCQPGCENSSCNYCVGGLFSCTRCNSAEGPGQ